MEAARSLARSLGRATDLLRVDDSQCRLSSSPRRWPAGASFLLRLSGGRRPARWPTRTAGTGLELQEFGGRTGGPTTGGGGGGGDKFKPRPRIERREQLVLRRLSALLVRRRHLRCELLVEREIGLQPAVLLNLARLARPRRSPSIWCKWYAVLSPPVPLLPPLPPLLSQRGASSGARQFVQVNRPSKQRAKGPK